MSEHPPTSPPMPIVVGAPRSGTTLLRLMLDAHPALAIPPETGFLPTVARIAGGAEGLGAVVDAVTRFPPDAPAWHDFGLDAEVYRRALDGIAATTPADAVRAFYRLYAARFGKARWGDKTPMYCHHLHEVAGLLPEAHFVHIIRDGRDVAQSVRPLWFSPGESVETRAAFWRDCVAAARAAASAVPGRYLEVRYEALVTAPEPVLRDVCAFLDLPYAPDMLTYHHHAAARLVEHRDRRRSDGTLLVSHATRLRQQALVMEPPQAARAQAWRRSMPADECARFAAVAGELLRDLGYG